MGCRVGEGGGWKGAYCSDEADGIRRVNSRNRVAEGSEKGVSTF